MGMFRIADKVALLSDGKIIEYGTPNEIRKSKNEVTMEFLNATKLPVFAGGRL
jgi:phospholipid/cholesterol/gamma-HCH transport system ATP-binding protein